MTHEGTKRGTPSDIPVLPISQLAGFFAWAKAERDPRAGWTIERKDAAVIALAIEAADDYRGWTGGHHWRCEFRTAAKGWKQGDPPVIECVCGLDRLNALLGEMGLNG